MSVEHSSMQTSLKIALETNSRRQVGVGCDGRSLHGRDCAALENAQAANAEVVNGSQ